MEDISDAAYTKCISTTHISQQSCVFQTDFGTILGVYTRFDKIYAFFVTGAKLKME